MLRRVRYIVIGGQEITVAKTSRWDFFKHVFETIMFDKTLIQLEKEYTGQKEVWLALGRAYDPNVAQKKETIQGWVNFLSNNVTKIQKLRIGPANQDVIESLRHQPQITELHIFRPGKGIVDLTALSDLPRLRKLVIEGFPAEATLHGLAGSKSLKELEVFSRKPIDFTPLTNMTGLESLEIGTGVDPAFFGTVKTPNFEFLKTLVNLKHLHIYSLVPEDKDLSPLTLLTNLEKGWYYPFRGQKPSTEELAALNPAFADVFIAQQRYLKSLKEEPKDEIPIHTKWKWGLK